MHIAFSAIQHNMRSRDPFLDLGNCDLRNELPGELAQCTWLKRINFGTQYWEPETTSWRQSIGGMDLANTFSGEEFDLLYHLPFLEELYFSEAGIGNIGFLEDLASLRRLHLGFNKISNIRPLTRHQDLQYLHIGSNKISDISVLEGLPQLTQLMLFKNNIRQFDLSLLNCWPQLSELRLSDNPITTIPTEILQSFNCLPGLKMWLKTN